MKNENLFQGKKILITGASGFIGTCLVNCLIKLNCDITSLGRKKVEGCKNIFCDFLKDDIPIEVFKNKDIVFHLAGYAHDISYKGNRALLTELNIKLTKNLVKICAESGVSKFLFLSSVKAENNFTKELKNLNFYGWTKKNAENKILEISATSSMKSIILRPALVYGPNLKGNLKKMYDAINSGWFPPLEDLKNRRSLVHVDDVIKCILFLIGEEINEEIIFTLTDENEYSTRKIYEIFCNLQNKKIPNFYIPISFLKVLKIFIPRSSFYLNKILEDDYYSSSKINRLGFYASKSLIDMNQSEFLKNRDGKNF